MNLLHSEPAVAPSNDVQPGVETRLLELARAQTAMDLVWASRFEGDQQIFDTLVGRSDWFGLTQGDALPIVGSYGQAVIAEVIPNVINDARNHPYTSHLAFTLELGIGSYVGVPIPARDGTAIGILGCVSAAAQPPARSTNLGFLKALAVALGELRQSEDRTDELVRTRRSVETVMREGRLRSVFQPIVDLQTGHIVGAEALTRFSDDQTRPDIWFADAERVGLGSALELRAISTALEHLQSIPPGVYLSVNASPHVICQPELRRKLDGVDLRRIVIEITEHAPVLDYAELTAAIDDHRSRGVRFAIDDVGAGYSSFNHVLRLNPDIVKLDLSITRNIDTDVARRGLARGLVSVAHDLGATVVAEGVERFGEIEALVALGIDCAQGFHLSRPDDLPLRIAPIGHRRDDQQEQGTA